MLQMMLMRGDNIVIRDINMTRRKYELIPWVKRDELKRHTYEKTQYALNGLECPKCRSELYDKNDVIYPTDPPQVAVMCLKAQCNFTNSRVK
jgi:hypothetical protein